MEARKTDRTTRIARVFLLLLLFTCRARTPPELSGEGGGGVTLWGGALGEGGVAVEEEGRGVLMSLMRGANLVALYPPPIPLGPYCQPHYCPPHSALSLVCLAC